MQNTPSSHLTLGLGEPLAWHVMLIELPYSSSIKDLLGAIKLGGINRSNKFLNSFKKFHFFFYHFF